MPPGATLGSEAGLPCHLPFALEAPVLIHGVIVAWIAGQDFWPMFAFGVAALVVVSQIHGLACRT